jgi:hypothetical protein
MTVLAFVSFSDYFAVALSPSPRIRWSLISE